MDPVYTSWAPPSGSQIDLTLNLKGDLSLIRTFTLTIEAKLSKFPTIVSSTFFKVTFTCDATESHGLTPVTPAVNLAF